MKPMISGSMGGIDICCKLLLREWRVYARFDWHKVTVWCSARSLPRVRNFGLYMTDGDEIQHFVEISNLPGSTSAAVIPSKWRSIVLIQSFLRFEVDVMMLPSPSGPDHDYVLPGTKSASYRRLTITAQECFELIPERFHNEMLWGEQRRRRFLLVALCQRF